MEYPLERLVGDNIPTDTIETENIRVKGGDLITYTPFPSGGVAGSPAYLLVASEITTDGTAGYNTQLYFQMWFAANHVDNSFSGGDLYFRYSLV